MLGFILKDILILKKYIKTVVLVLAFYGIMQGMSSSFSIFSFMLFFLGTMIPMTAATYDEQAKWDTYAITLPVERKDIIKAKYLFSIGIMLICGILGIVSSFVINITTHRQNSLDNLVPNAAALGIGILFISILLPILIKFGSEKGRYIIMPIYLIPSIIIYVLATISNFHIKLPPENVLVVLFSISPFISLVFYGISYLFSVRIYEKKEF